MSKGYVYILRNPSMPGLVKIGKTTRSVQQRCHELWQTGVPTPFEVVHQVATPNCDALESFLHGYLSVYRVSQSREFFKVDQADAIKAATDFLREQVEELVHEYYPGHDLLMEPYVDPGEFGEVAQRAGITESELAEAFRFIERHEIMPAVTRWREHRLKRGIARDYSQGGGA